MDNINQNQDELSSVLRMNGINITKYQNILNHIKFSNDKGCVKLNFPHKYLFELYKNELKNIIEHIFKGNINYVVNDYIEIQENKIKINNCKTNEYNFENFISGNNNKIILGICKEISNSKQVKYNPVVIYGESSSGKTHIVNAIINQEKNKKKFIKDLFEINQIISSNNLSEIYSNIIRNGIAVIENINEIKNEISSILLEKIIDHYYENQKQIIFTYKGKKIKSSNFSESLFHRINSGLCLKLRNPDLNVKINFAKRFSQENKINLSSDNIFTISCNCDSIRSIKGMLLKLTTLQDNSCPVTPKQINELFEENWKNTQADFKNILHIVSAATGHSAGDLLGMRRGKKISQARQICMFLCKHKLNWSYPKIGNKFGGRDHSTAIYSVKKIEQLKKVNKEINNMLTYLFLKIDNVPKNDLLK